MKTNQTFFNVVAFLIVIVVSASPAWAADTRTTSESTPAPKSLPIVRPAERAAPGITKRQPVNERKSSVYCCENSKIVVKRLTANELKANRDSCSSSRAVVEKYCGFCCQDGKTTPVTDARTQELCKKTEGLFLKSARECRPDDVYCCSNGKVTKVSSSSCRKQNGTPFKTLQQARNECGWCCEKNRVVAATSDECRRKGGKYDNTFDQARKMCRQTSQKTVGLKPGNTAAFPGSVRESQLILQPDLEISTTLTRKCFMKITVRNNGGPIKAVDHSASTIHISAGSGLISPKTKLKEIDPGGQLRTADSMISYTTGLRITRPNQTALVWLDTNNKIQESNETNNGDDAVLTCKATLAWCCTKRGTVQMIADECGAMGGTTHKTETEAIKKCGPPEDTSRSKALKTDEGGKIAPSKQELYRDNSQSQVLQRDVSQGSPPPTPNINPMPYDNNLPNLAIDNVSVTQLAGSSEVTINFEVINTGGPVEDTFTVSLYQRGGSQLDSVNIHPPMEPNGVRNLQFSFQSSTTLCLNNIGIRADIHNTIHESDEVGQNWVNDDQDNVWWGELPTLVAGACPQALTLQPLVAYIPARLVVTLQKNTIPDPNIPGNENIQVMARVKNVGSVESSAETTINMQLTDHPYLHYLDVILPFWEEMIPRLAPNEEHTVTRTFTIPALGLDGEQILPGQFRLLSIINQENLQQYEQVVNDELIFQYNGLLPDLVVCFKKYNAHHPGKVTYPVKIKNIGVAPSAPANLRFSIQSKGGTNHSIPSLPAGGEHTVQREVRWWLYEMGTDPHMYMDFTLTIDNNDDVIEGIIGESNNVINGHILIKRWQHSINPGQNSQTQCSNVPGMAN